MQNRRAKGQRVELFHVRGHQGETGNEGADFLANRGVLMAEEKDRDWEQARMAVELGFRQPEVVASQVSTIAAPRSEVASQAKPGAATRSITVSQLVMDVSTTLPSLPASLRTDAGCATAGLRQHRHERLLSRPHATPYPSASSNAAQPFTNPNAASLLNATPLLASHATPSQHGYASSASLPSHFCIHHTPTKAAGDGDGDEPHVGRCARC